RPFVNLERQNFLLLKTCIHLTNKPLKRRNFIGLTALGMGGLMLYNVPTFGHEIDPARALEPFDAVLNKRLADVALNAAKSKGATYTDVRIGRYLSQNMFTREKQVQGISTTESYGVGVRVIANGTWGFAATSDVSDKGIAKAAEQAVAI